MLTGLSARVFGFSSFSILLPQALCTIAAVAVLFATVRRVAGDLAGLVAALVLALTPITVAIGRVNNPDALLVLLLVVSAWFTVRALETGRGKHLAFAGAIVGLAFMTKMLQGWMVVPALGLAYLVAGPPALWVRVRQLAVAFAVMVAVSGAWPLAVTLWPGSKPYIGGSTDGSVWNLILGYNGFGRISARATARAAGEARPSAAPPGCCGCSTRRSAARSPGCSRWLASSLVCGLWFTRGAPRTDLRRAGLILFGTWASSTSRSSRPSRASSTRTTSAPSRPRSRRSSACGWRAPRGSPRWRSPPLPGCQSACLTAHQTSCRGCAWR